MERDPINLELENLQKENRQLKLILEARRKQVIALDNLVEALNIEIAEYELKLK